MGVVRRMVEAFPGSRIRVPKNFREGIQGGNKFYDLSQEDQRLLVGEFGGEDIDIPTSLKTTLWRCAKIKEMYGRVKAEDIALEVGLTRRRVFEVARRMGLTGATSGRETERHDLVISAFKSGSSIPEIADRAGYSTSWVRCILRNNGLKGSKRKRNAVSSISDGYLTHHAEGASNTPSRNTKKPARAPENAI